MAQILHRVNLHQVRDLDEAVRIIHSKIKDLIRLMTEGAGGHTPRCLLIGKSPTKSLSKRRFDLKKKGYDNIVVIAELDEAVALRLFQSVPDKCALQMSEMLSRCEYGEGIYVIRQKRGTAKGEGEPASLFVGFSSKGIIYNSILTKSLLSITDVYNIHDSS